MQCVCYFLKLKISSKNLKFECIAEITRHEFSSYFVSQSKQKRIFLMYCKWPLEIMIFSLPSVLKLLLEFPFDIYRFRALYDSNIINHCPVKVLHRNIPYFQKLALSSSEIFRMNKITFIAQGMDHIIHSILLRPQSQTITK